MLYRFLTLTAVVASGFISLAPAAEPAGAKAPAGKAWTPPRTPDGVPDLQGVYSSASSTPVERPQNLGAKEFYTEAELAENESRSTRRAAVADRAGTAADVHYDVSQFGLDRGHAKVARNLRTSIVVGPEGKIPPMTAEAQKRIADRAALNRGHQFDGPENRGMAERCLTWGNVGPPMLPVGYNSDLQIVQGAGYVAIMQEMIHDVRTIPTDGRPHLDSNIRQWFGDSRGRWEGNTLVVDTTNFSDRGAFRNASPNLHVVERFTRTDADTVLYQFTVEDPATWTKAWSGEFPMMRVDTPIYEYACQEGNYGMANVLSGARAEEKKIGDAAKTGAK
jgi:hypothetical protein